MEVILPFRALEGELKSLQERDLEISIPLQVDKVAMSEAVAKAQRSCINKLWFVCDVE